MVEITTIQVSKETLRQLKLRKVVLDFENMDELINYMLQFTPNSYVAAEDRPEPPSIRP